MSSVKKPDPALSPLLSFEQTRKAHLEDFLKSTPDQRLEWLGQMLEVMQLAYEARMHSQVKGSPAPRPTVDP